MARRNNGRKPMKPKMIAWKDSFAELFKLGASWTPPSHVQVRRTVLGATFVAVFQDDDGRPFRLTARIEIDDASGAMFLVDQKLSITARVRGRAPIATAKP